MNDIPNIKSAILMENFNFENGLEKKRWGLLAGVFLYTFTNQGTWCTFSPIVDPSKNYYNIDASDVNWFVYSFYITYAIFSFMGSWGLSNKFAASISLGIVMNAIGSWLRYFAFENFSLALIGQFIMGISFCIILEAPILIAQKWFHFKERFFVVTLLCLASSLGSGLGFLFPAIFVGKNENMVERCLLIEAILCTTPIFFIAFIRNKPKIAPNAAEKMPKMGFINSFKLLFKDRRYMFAMMAFGTIYGNSWDLFSILGNLLDPKKIENETIGMAGALSVAASAIGSFGINLYVHVSRDSSKYVDLIIKVLFFVGTLTFGLFSLTLHMQDKTYIFEIMIILGCTAMAITPLSCVCLEEISFPALESVSLNFMFFTSNLLSLLLSYLVTMPNMGSKGSWILFVTLVPFAFYILFFYKTDFKKSMNEGIYSSFNLGKEHNNLVYEDTKMVNNETAAAEASTF